MYQQFVKNTMKILRYLAQKDEDDGLMQYEEVILIQHPCITVYVVAILFLGNLQPFLKQAVLIGCWVPTLNMGYVLTEKSNSRSLVSADRDQRRQNRKRKREESDVVAPQADNLKTLALSTTMYP